MIVNRDDDPFDMDSIIEAVTREHKGKKRSIQEVEVEPWEVLVDARCTRLWKMLVFSETDETSHERSPRAS